MFSDGRQETKLQAAVPKILGETTKDFFDKTVQMLKLSADMCYNKLLKIGCISCAHRPEGSMFVMVKRGSLQLYLLVITFQMIIKRTFSLWQVKLDVSGLENIKDDMDFCRKLAGEESVIIMPGNRLNTVHWFFTVHWSPPYNVNLAICRYCLGHEGMASDHLCCRTSTSGRWTCKTKIFLSPTQEKLREGSIFAPEWVGGEVQRLVESHLQQSGSAFVHGVL